VYSGLAPKEKVAFRRDDLASQGRVTVTFARGEQGGPIRGKACETSLLVATPAVINAHVETRASFKRKRNWRGAFFAPLLAKIQQERERLAKWNPISSSSTLCGGAGCVGSISPLPLL